MTRTVLIRMLMALCAALSSPVFAAPDRPDLIVVGSRIETSELRTQPVEAFAVTRNIFSYVGSASKALKLAGPKTRICGSETSVSCPVLSMPMSTLPESSTSIFAISKASPNP